MKFLKVYLNLSLLAPSSNWHRMWFCSILSIMFDFIYYMTCNSLNILRQNHKDFPCAWLISSEYLRRSRNCVQCKVSCMNTKENNSSAASVRRSSAYQIANAQKKEQKLSMSLSAQNNERLYLDGVIVIQHSFHDTNCDFLSAVPTSTHS